MPKCCLFDDFASPNIVQNDINTIETGLSERMYTVSLKLTNTVKSNMFKIYIARGHALPDGAIFLFVHC
jgi:hypothetical protein